MTKQLTLTMPSPKSTPRAGALARRLMIGTIDVSGFEVVVAFHAPSADGTGASLGHNHETA